MSEVSLYIAVLLVHIFLSTGSIAWVAVERDSEKTLLKQLQGYFTHEKLPPPQDHHRTLGIVLL